MENTNTNNGAFTSDAKSDENITTQIAREEHFVQGQAKKDPNAVYIEDNPQKALEKLRSISSIENYQEKIQYVKHLAELISVIGEEGLVHLKEIIVSIQDDSDEIKRALLTQITPLVTYLKSREEKGCQEIIDIVIPTVNHLINSTNYDIKEEAGQELSKIAPILNEDDRGRHLLTIVLGMAHDDENEENRMIAVRLLSEMAPLFGKDLCEQFVGLEFLSMGEDPQLRVRKEAVSNLPSIGKIVSPYFFKQRLLPFYLKLCKDTNWGVRKSCVDTLYEIANICKDELTNIREEELTEAMNNFIKDSNKWVKISAYKNLGPLISTLMSLKINEKLVDSYVHMADSNINNLSPDNEIIFACAYNFPAVVLTLGPSKWPVLSKLFQALTKSNDRVRKPLACSLHEIAKIIGEEKTEKDLLSVLELFLKDPNDDIKYGAIQNLALFLKVFRIEKREDMVDIFVQLQKDQKKWRIRELIAQQIDKLTLIFPPRIIFEIITPISFKLCNDQVAFVREEASRKIHSILKVLAKSDEGYTASVIENIKGFSQSNRYTNRQSYAAMCEKIMKNADLFMEHFYVHLLPLANDRVPNVRIAVAKALQKVFNKNINILEPICEKPEILLMIAKMRTDKSRDVKNLIDPIIKERNLKDEYLESLIQNEPAPSKKEEESKTAEASTIDQSQNLATLTEEANHDKAEESVKMDEEKETQEIKAEEPVDQTPAKEVQPEAQVEEAQQQEGKIDEEVPKVDS